MMDFETAIQDAVAVAMLAAGENVDMPEMVRILRRQADAIEEAMEES